MKNRYNKVQYADSVDLSYNQEKDSDF